MSEYTSCPNCGSTIKSGLISSVTLLEKAAIAVINEYHTDKHDAYCTKCGMKLFEKYSEQLKAEKTNLTSNLGKKLHLIPIVSCHTPLHWDYMSIGIVTGQSVTGTGAFAEFASAWTDFLGKQSGAYNDKIRGGENLCFAQLRKQTLDRGGNAILAVDIDYSELGGLKGMIMVCMTGTAVTLKNVDLFGSDRAMQLENLSRINQRIQYLEKL